MTAIASPEFVSLCQAQLRLLTQQMSGSSAAVYIADMTGQMADAAWAGRQRNEPNFVPVVSYPEPVERWIENFARATAWAADAGPLALMPGADVDEAAIKEPEKDLRKEPEDYPSEDYQSEDCQEGSSDWPQTLQPDRQLVVPMVYADVVVGLMVAIRRDRAWDSEERHYMDSVAQSLAAGCVLEQRTQWLQSQIADKRDLQSRQSEIFHNLLHQFRNPLTAVTTFGQLLVRRLEPEDPNQKIATGIVRESKRLREMVAHFDETVAIGDADLATEPVGVLSLPASPRKLLPGRETASERDAALPMRDEAPFTTSASDMSASESSLDDLNSSEALPVVDADSAVDGLAPSPNATGAAGLGHALSLCAQYLPDIVEPILAVASIVAMEKGVNIQSQVASDTPLVWGEEEALGEVVSNLVDNAVKYSPSGARVWVQTGVSHTSEAHHYQGVVIGDTGPGIPPDDLVRLFERNYRGVQAQSDIPGTGLGLAIAQSLMTQMQGFIEVISPAVGTPWMPSDLFTTAQSLAQQGDLPVSPGTVFIVWLREAETP